MASDQPSPQQSEQPDPQADLIPVSHDPWQADPGNLIPVDHDPFEGVGASMQQHLAGNQSQGPGTNPAEAFWDWRQAGGLAGPGNSWADRMNAAMQSGDRQAQIDLMGGFAFGGMARPTTPPGFAENLADLIGKGFSNKQIADQLGVSRSTVLRNVIKQGLTTNPDPHTVGVWGDPKNLDLFHEMYTAGASDSQIGKVFGLTEGAIESKRSNMGLSAKNPPNGSVAGGGYTRRWGGDAEGFLIPRGPQPSMPTTALPDPGSPGDKWLMEQLGYKE